ncbi:universal stress protein [Loigolactobacillus backii]|uniref:Universal stress protein UspA n=1 Tax=Loigolactobacillus backii TaxID=375175 RepID=A0A192GZT5_9LACO|nr:universal stress protein [Loigolactobacillus backii]ANK60818.1 universal stress protein UspA [Loigolactobacillus backii]ANK61610.1 universal stress protein UspA [Loigolactobacillus backii]ANK65772.1 universal stress protein UspA [Loigolactobacillus backii]ANK68248.1 universal stress protein UspA [Loigolactobacillus backii]ANK69190.1 universal stress protein UspA [Loigolactobacillus backii]
MLQEYHNILVPVDGSKEAELALQKAVAVAKRNNAHLDILDVLATQQFEVSYSSFIDGDVIYKMSEDVKKYLDRLANDIKEKSDFNDVTIHIRFGNPKTIISRDFPQEHKNDLIMIGATGLNAVERVLVGSVASYVNRNAITDVLVVKTRLNNKEAQEK